MGFEVCYTLYLEYGAQGARYKRGYIGGVNIRRAYYVRFGASSYNYSKEV